MLTSSIDKQQMDSKNRTEKSGSENRTAYGGEMAQKDIAEKILEAHPDVFADVVNVLGFDGKTKLRPSELEELSARSHYKVEGLLHELERDVVKCFKDTNIYIACIGFENQTASDLKMPMRVLCYDAADYGKQLCEKIKNNYPVITFVLYFGQKPWSGSQNLRGCLNIPDDDWEHLVSDYNINLYQIAYLSQEQIELFKSDFKLIADFLVQKRKNGTYIGNKQKFIHKQETLQLLTAITGDRRYEELYNQEHPERGPNDMCDVVDQFIAKGKAEGKAEGLAEGVVKGKAEGLAEGLVKGRTEAESNLSLLINKLFSLNRVDDLRKAADDQAFLDKLMKEFGIA